jgi:deoxyribonuclease-1-like protein
MFQIRRRWQVLTGVVAVVAYVLNNYQIEGLDKLQLRQRSPTEIAQRRVNGVDWRDDLLGELGGQIGNGPSLPIGPSPLNHLPSGSNANQTLTPFPSTTPAYPSSSNASNFLQSPTPKTLMPNTGVLANDLAPAGLPVGSSTPLGSMVKPLLPPATLEPDLGKLLSVDEKLAIWAENATNSLQRTAPVPDHSAGNGAIQIGSFHIQSLGTTKLAKPHVVEILIRILRRFDIVAIQGVQSNRDDILPTLVERLNHSGRSYDYMIGPRVGRVAPQEQFAFIFDSQRLETDRYQLYTIDDPDDLITYEPLVAWFRTKGVSSRDAFTFSLINVHLPAELAEQERQLLPNLINAVQSDGRNEDDWILLGDLSCGDAELYSLSGAGARMALTGIPTDTHGDRMLDEIFFSGSATSEFTGRSGAFDFLRQYNLSIEQAIEVSDHLPVWATFSILEGGDPGRIAPVAK